MNVHSCSTTTCILTGNVVTGFWCVLVQVVMHRGQQVASPDGSLVRGGSVGSMGEAADNASSGVPQSILAEVGTTQIIPDNHESIISEGVRRRTVASRNQPTFLTDTYGWSEPQRGGTSTPPPPTSAAEDDEDMTPRWGTAAQQRVQTAAEESVQSSPRMVSAPTFPFFNFGRR